MTGIATMDRLAAAPLTVLGTYPHASNTTILVHLSDANEPPADVGGDVLDRVPSRDLGIWKPVAGQAPLWDFDAATLPGREVAAYVVDQLLGTDLVPPTVFREDGPLGPGSLQAHVPHDPAMHLLAWEERDDFDPASLGPLVVLDMVINNTDRKASHVLFGPTRFWAIDHGVTFHVEDKLRTVAWQLQGEPVPAHLRAAAGRLAAHLADGAGDLDAHLQPDEVIATIQRAARVAKHDRFPLLQQRAQLPWPLV